MKMTAGAFARASSKILPHRAEQMSEMCLAAALPFCQGRGDQRKAHCGRCQFGEESFARPRGARYYDSSVKSIPCDLAPSPCLDVDDRALRPGDRLVESVEFVNSQIARAELGVLRRGELPDVVDAFCGRPIEPDG